MRIANRITISLALVAALLLSSATVSAQLSTAPTSDWSRLNAVTAGSKVSVKLKSGKTVDGKLSGVSDAALSLTIKDKPVDVKREDVLSVYQIKKKSVAKATLIGLGVGAGAGLAIGVAGRSKDNLVNLNNPVTAGLTVLGAAAGALTGFLIGRTGGKRVLIYQATQP
jgi:small nuclear ribonucleoprotein (snRNP)-like protein